MTTVSEDADSAGPDGDLQSFAMPLRWEATGWDVKLASLRASDAFLGYPAAEWRPDDGLLEKHVHPEDWRALLATLHRAAAQGGTHRCDHRLLRTDGATLWVETTVTRGTHASGRHALAASTLDVTHRKAIEQSLRRGEARATLLLNGIRGTGVFVVTAAGRIESWTAGAESCTGRSAAEMNGAPLSILFPQGQVGEAAPVTLLMEATREQQATYEGQLVRRGGASFWGRLTLRLVSGVEDADALAATVVDLSEQQRTTRSLRHSEELFRRLVDSVQDHAMFMVSAEGRVETWNSGAQRLKGYRAHEIVGRPLTTFFPREQLDAGLVGRMMTEAARAGTSRYEGLLVRSDGSTFWAAMSLSGVEDEQGQLRGFANVSRDLSGRRRAEEALARSEQHFRLLVDSVRDYAMFMLSVDGTVESWNPGAQRLKGYRAEEVVGASMARFFEPRDVEQRVPEGLRDAAELTGHATYEGWLLRKGGSHFWGLLTLNAVEDERGRLVGFSNVARDLTERRGIEEKLRRSEEQVRLLVDSLQDHAVFMLSATGRIEGWSPAAQRIHGYADESIVGEPFAALFSHETNESGVPARLLAQAGEHGRAQHDGWLTRRGSGPFWCNLVLSAVKDRQGALHGFAIVTRDVSEQMRLQRERALLAETSAVLGGSVDYASTLERVARLVTRETAQVCMVSVLMGGALRPLTIAHVDETRQRLLEQALRPVVHERPLGRGPSYVVRSGRSELYADVSAHDWVGDALGFEPRTLVDLGVRSYMCVPLTAHGTVLGAMTLLGSASHPPYGKEDLLLAEELGRRAGLAIDNARSHQRSLDAIRMREEVLALVSHDLGTPLSAIQMHAAALAARDDGGHTGSEATGILHAAEHMSGLMADLIDFASFEAGRLRLDVAAHDAARPLEDAVELLGPSAAAAGVRLAVSTEAGQVNVLCDRARVVRALANLIGNAVKFAGPDGLVEVRVGAERDGVVYSVRDTGRGISAEELPHIFDAYWQAERRARTGMGLGLAIAQRIVTAHGSVIHVESEPGSGTTFGFTLPRARRAP